MEYQSYGEMLYCAATAITHAAVLYVRVEASITSLQGGEERAFQGQLHPLAASPGCAVAATSNDCALQSWLEAAELHSVVASVTRGQHHHTTTKNQALVYYNTSK